MKNFFIISFILFIFNNTYNQINEVDSLLIQNALQSNISYSKYAETHNPVDNQYYYFLITKDHRLIYKVNNDTWKYFNTNGLDYKKMRNGDSVNIKKIDMVAADGNRIIVKLLNSNDLYYTLLKNELNENKIFHFINDPQPHLKLTKKDVKLLIKQYDLAAKYSKKMGLNLFTVVLKIRHKLKPFWWVCIENSKTWYSIEYDFNQENELINDLAVTYVNTYENDSVFKETSGYDKIIGGDYHWPLFNKWYNKWLRKDIEGNRHYTTFIDGSVCYYILSKDTSDYILIEKDNNVIKKYRFKVYFVDEQSYFSERFRLVGPDPEPPLFSAQRGATRTKKNLDNEIYLPWQPENHWWAPYDIYFEDCSIDGAVENIILSTKDKIYSINWTFWSMDFCWRARNKPKGIEEINIIIDRNMNIRIPNNIDLKPDYFTQKLLPEDNLLPIPNSTEMHFKHENKWNFIIRSKNHNLK